MRRDIHKLCEPFFPLVENPYPLRWSYDDVATPYGNPCDEELEDKCDCNELGPDGFMDLVLHFDTQEVVAALGEVCDGKEPNLFITGYLLDGTPISGRDVVIILNKGKKK